MGKEALKEVKTCKLLIIICLLKRPQVLRNDRRWQNMVLPVFCCDFPGFERIGVRNS